MNFPANIEINWVKSIDSTSAAIYRDMEKLPDKYALVADEQSEGRGQGDHRWHSKTGSNLTFSIFIRYDKQRVLLAQQQQVLTQATSLAVCDFLKDCCSIKADIKKPNDILVNGRKICGILIQNGLRGQNVVWSIIGIGLNVNETNFPKDLPNPVSIRQLTSTEMDIEKCLKDFLRHFDNRFDAIWTESESLYGEYLKKSF